jgi:hypothetical protein
MKRSFLALTATLLAAVAVPGIASAAQLELGKTTSPVISPECPAGVTQTNCKIVLTQVTAYETMRDGTRNAMLITKPGELVAFTLGVSSLSSDPKTVKADIAYLNGQHGGAPEVQLTVLRPVGKRSKIGWAVAGQSAPYLLQHYLGSVAQFPLTTPLAVVPGEVVGLTVATWAPVLSIDLSNKFAYRQSHGTNCNGNTPMTGSLAQLTIGALAPYQCNYVGTRPEYSATEITTPSYSS